MLPVSAISDRKARKNRPNQVYVTMSQMKEISIREVHRRTGAWVRNSHKYGSRNATQAIFASVLQNQLNRPIPYLTPKRNARFADVRHRGRTASCPNRPRTDPGVPFFSTGLFESTRFRIGQSEGETSLRASSLLFPAVRLALLNPALLARQCFLCQLRTSVSPFPW